jgi:hypothetical protein
LKRTFGMAIDSFSLRSIKKPWNSPLVLFRHLPARRLYGAT